MDSRQGLGRTDGPGPGQVDAPPPHLRPVPAVPQGGGVLTAAMSPACRAGPGPGAVSAAPGAVIGAMPDRGGATPARDPGPVLRPRRVRPGPGTGRGAGRGADRLGWALVVIFSAAVNALMLTGPVFMLQIYDRVMAAGSGATLAMLFGLVCGLYAGMAALDVARLHLAADIGARMQSRLEMRLAALGPAAARQGVGVDEIEAIRRSVASPGLLALVDLIWTPLFLVVLFSLHPWLGWAGFAGGAVLGVAALWHYRAVRPSARRAAQAAEAAAQIWAGLRPTGGGPAGWRRQRAVVAAAALSVGRRGAVHVGLSRSFRLFLQSALLALGAWLVLRGEATPGVMVAATILAGRALAPVEQAAAHWPLMREARRARTRLAAAGLTPDTIVPRRGSGPGMAQESAFDPAHAHAPAAAAGVDDLAVPFAPAAGPGRAAALRLVPAGAGGPLPARRGGPAPRPDGLVRLWPVALAGMCALALLVAGAFAWAVAAPVAGSVALPGRVQAGTGSLALHPPAGAMRVTAILVDEGARVAAGAPLVRFDDPVALAELAEAEVHLAEARTRAARHAADLAILARADPAAEPAGGEGGADPVAGDAVMGAALAASAALDRAAASGLAAARTAQAGQRAALDRQRRAVARQAALVGEELGTQQRLLDQGLAQAGRSLALQREAARLDGVLAEIDALAARAAQALAEVEAATARTRAERQRLAAEGLAAARAQEATLAARLPALRARAEALILRAPGAAEIGAISARAGVQVVPGEAALWLVPEGPLRIVAWLPDRLGGLIAPEVAAGSAADGGAGGRLDAEGHGRDTPHVLRAGASLRLRLPPESAPAAGAEVSARIVSIAAEARAPAGGSPAAPPQFRILLAPGPEAATLLRPGLPVEVLVPTPARPAWDRLRAALAGPPD